MKRFTNHAFRSLPLAELLWGKLKHAHEIAIEASQRLITTVKSALKYRVVGIFQKIAGVFYSEMIDVGVKGDSRYPLEKS